MPDWILPSTATALVGFVGGIILGLAARLGKFCTLAAIEDALFSNNTIRWRMWVLAIVVASAWVHVAAHYDLLSLSSTFYASRPLNLVTIILGGVFFGVGMALVGTCGFGTLVRLGGGDLKSFLVFVVIAIAAFMAAAGPTARFRLMFLDRFNVTSDVFEDARIPKLISAYTDVPETLVVVVIIAVFLAWVFSLASFRQNIRAIIWSIVVGSVIFWGWFGTGWLALDEFEPQPVQSYSFVRPLGASIMYLMTSSGSTVGFGIGSVVGVLLGAFAGAIRLREFRWQASDDAREAKRQIFGAFLMGTGGMFALGCTVGQGLSAMSVLAISAPLVLASIWFGAWLGLSYLMSGSIRFAIERLFGGHS